MSSVQVERVGTEYIVSRRFECVASAMRGVELLGGVEEKAFVPAHDQRPGLNPVSQATGD